MRHVTLGAPLEGYPDCYEAAQVRTGRTGTPRRAVQAPPPETKTMKGTGRPGQVLGPPWWTVISNNNGVMVLRRSTQAEVEAVEDEIAAYKRLTQCQR